VKPLQGTQRRWLKFLKQLQPKRSQTGYVHATVGMHSERRLLRRASLEMKRIKDAGYLDEVLTTQFKHRAGQVHGGRAARLRRLRVRGRDLAVEGCAVLRMPQDEIISFQDGVLEKGIYPERLEIGSVASLGALNDYLSFTRSKVPTLLLELGFESTHSFISPPRASIRPARLPSDSLR
jgi:hypothetical protein